MRVASLLCFILGCGGTVGGALDGATDSIAPWDGGSPDEAGFTSCTTPEGYGICGAKTPCPFGAGRPSCSDCPFAKTDCGSVPCPEGTNLGDGLGLCIEDYSAVIASGCPEVEDGYVCWDDKAVGPNFPLAGIPYSLGVLLAPYVNRPDRLRYADLGLWTGATLPTPATCPSFQEFQVCGPTCGGCAAGQRCVGRSPLHPYGVCVEPSNLCTRDGTLKCPGVGDACFFYKVEPDAQALADLHGQCMPLAKCNALASKLPGGGYCVQQ